MSAASNNKFAGKALGMKMSALSGTSVVYPRLDSKKQAVSNNFFSCAPSMSAQVPRAQAGGPT
jgi:hypothetical protein